MESQLLGATRTPRPLHHERDCGQPDDGRRGPLSRPQSPRIRAGREVGASRRGPAGYGGYGGTTSRPACYSASSPRERQTWCRRSRGGRTDAGCYTNGAGSSDPQHRRTASADQHDGRRRRDRATHVYQHDDSPSQWVDEPGVWRAAGGSRRPRSQPLTLRSLSGARARRRANSARSAGCRGCAPSSTPRERSRGRRNALPLRRTASPEEAETEPPGEVSGEVVVAEVTMSKPARSSLAPQFFGRIAAEVAEVLVERGVELLTGRHEETQVAAARGEVA